MIRRLKKPLQNRQYLHFIISLVLLMVTYILASWAIDIGSLVVYAITFVIFFIALKFLISFFKLAFFNNDEKPKTSKSARKNTRG